MIFPKILPKKIAGIDVGTSAIKVVELSSWANRIRLDNYGEISAAALYQKPFRTFEKSALLLSTEEVARAVKAVMLGAKIKAKKCVFSIPDFSTFFTAFELPPMTASEIPQAVNAEARKHVPVPLNEVTLDWQLIEGAVPDQGTTKLKILMVAVPNEVIAQYRRIAEVLNMNLMALEAEVFGLMRALIDKEETRTVGLIDIGARSTTCSIIDNKILKVSHSFDVSGNTLTERIAKGLSLDYEAAENFKKKYGILPDAQLGLEGSSIKEVLSPLIDMIIIETDKIFKKFYWETGKEVGKIILAGGAALLAGLEEYLKDYFKKEVEVANPFRNIFYPPILEPTLKEMGPSYAIAVGMALRGLEA